MTREKCPPVPTDQLASLFGSQAHSLEGRKAPMARSAGETVAGIPELLRFIFDHASHVDRRETVYVDRYAILTNLALVSRTFASVAQKLLFSHVYLRGVTSASSTFSWSPEVYEDKWSGSNRFAPGRAILGPKSDKLASALEARPALASHVRVMRIIHVLGDDPALARLLPLLPNLQALRIRLIDDRVLASLDLRTLTRLEVSIGSPSALVTLLTATPSLHSLTVGDGTDTRPSVEVHESEWNAAMVNELHLACKLRSLSLSVAHQGWWQVLLADWLLAEAKSDLRSLELSDLIMSDYADLPPRLERISLSSRALLLMEPGILFAALPATVVQMALGPFNGNKYHITATFNEITPHIHLLPALRRMHLTFGQRCAQRLGEDIAHEGALESFMAGPAWLAFEAACETAQARLTWTTEPFKDEPFMCPFECDQLFGALWP